MRILDRLTLSFDRSFSVARFRQFLWLIGLLVTGFFIIYVLNVYVLDKEIKHPAQIIELMIDPGTYVAFAEDVRNMDVNQDEVVAAHEDADWILWFPFLIMAFGAVFFTGSLISIISNMLEGRVDAFKSGVLRYNFRNHILILGANEMLANMIRALVQNPKNKKKDIVILSSKPTEELRAKLFSELNNDEVKYITLLYGNRTSKDELKQIQVKHANRVYILGEDDEKEHDALNISCIESIKEMCKTRDHVLKCFMVINNFTSFHVFQFQTEKNKTDDNKMIELTIINALENWAQQVLVMGKFDKISYRPIDRDGIAPDSDKRVHFVVIGMTQMALAMANTVAHIAHYPNFKTKGIRTKITFIAENIEQEMNFFKGHYSSLFQLSNSTYYKWNGNEFCRFTESPEEGFKDFLDIEWEFVDSGIETPQVRNLLKKWSTEYENDYLTIAVCGKNPVANIATALYLPHEINDKDIPVYVFQPTMGKVLEQAKNTKRYSNIFPFGMKHDCYDPQLHQRILQAKRINYLYNKSEHYIGMTTDEEELDTLWNKLSFADKLSNIYAANSIASKFRSLSINPQKTGEFSDETVEIMAEMEHNRWNIEKLLVGFRAMKLEERKKLSPEEAKRKKKEEFVHKDIVAYNDLEESSKIYDRCITKHLKDVLIEE